MDAFWFDPRKGTWRVGERSFREPIPFLRDLETGKGKALFDPPGDPGPGNDWVLVLRKHPKGPPEGGPGARGWTAPKAPQAHSPRLDR